MRDLAAVINEAGGIAGAADLARRWNVSRASMTEMIQRHPDFPKPVALLGNDTHPRPIYSTKQADAWRMARIGYITRDSTPQEDARA